MREWVYRNTGRSIIWGQTDCASLVRRYLEEFYGVDLSKYKYDSKFSAMKMWAHFDKLEDAFVRTELEVEKKRIPFCQDGDIVVIDNDREPSVGIVFRAKYLTSNFDLGMTVLNQLVNCTGNSYLLEVKHG